MGSSKQKLEVTRWAPAVGGAQKESRWNLPPTLLTQTLHGLEEDGLVQKLNAGLQPIGVVFSMLEILGKQV